MRVLVAMSGGVDSSYVAKSLKDAGHEVVGCYMVLHDKPSYHEKNIENVRAVGKFLGIKTEILDLRAEFARDVYNPFVEIYKSGKTPNPCAMCNREIKLGKMLEFALNLGCEKLATGHYVRVEDGLLKVARDEGKDQSYFLANIDPNSLQYMLFPLGDRLKSEIRDEVMKYPEISNIATQKESSEICFVDRSYIDILERHTNTKMPGNVVDKYGNIIGRHDGYMHYTIGKRRGFTVDGAHDPHFVTAINPDKNEITVGLKDDLQSSKFSTQNFNAFLKFGDEFEAGVKIRYRSPKVGAKARVLRGENGVKFLEVELKTSVYGIASGQLAVFYDDKERVIASGFIN